MEQEVFFFQGECQSELVRGWWDRGLCCSAQNNLAESEWAAEA